MTILKTKQRGYPTGCLASISTSRQHYPYTPFFYAWVTALASLPAPLHTMHTASLLSGSRSKLRIVPRPSQAGHFLGLGDTRPSLHSRLASERVGIISVVGCWLHWLQ